ncbi:MAG: HAMP domain-containing protein [Proteobacteria bacterium]|nr:HAMP domain-containing protein [Desulfobacula sp.]MBU3953608.1 HAMP domain-containing protein [Pseudomonadota bacterium]MBU4132496.1 HAMP domain-containing protein [Pseudomonadota bacterium]
MIVTPKSPSLSGFYFIGLGATMVGILVIAILNLSTPLDFIIARLQVIRHGGPFRLALLLLAAGLASLPFLAVLRGVLAPISECLILKGQHHPVSPALEQRAKQRLINLPFIMVPVNMVFWIFIPMVLFGGIFALNKMDFTTAITFSIRSTMVGLISSAVIFFGLETHARRVLIPYFFPTGELACVEGTIKISLLTRIRALYRLASLIPLANIVLTLFILYLQVDPDTMSAKTYGQGVLIFSLVVFVLFFLGSGVLNRLVSRSIADPINGILKAMKEIEQGNYHTRVKVVSNDEVGILGDATNKMIQSLGEKELLRDAFGRYVAPEVRDEIISGRIPLDGEFKDVTILFADLRDFTPMTEANDPKRVVRILNDYFKEMSAAITAHSGLILQFLGDEIYAVFGAPVSCKDHPSNAFFAALDMEERLAALNKRFALQKTPCLSHGIGIHTGQVLAANIGSPDRLSYLLVGDAVNLASRLQSLTRELSARIIVSADTAAFLPEHQVQTLLVKHPRPMQIKGRKNLVDIYLSK